MDSHCEMSGLTELVLKETVVPGAKLYKDPAKCNIEELKRWLECHGQKKGGKKGELIDRVRGFISFNLAVDPGR